MPKEAAVRNGEKAAGETVPRKIGGVNDVLC